MLAFWIHRYEARWPLVVQVVQFLGSRWGAAALSGAPQAVALEVRLLPRVDPYHDAPRVPAEEELSPATLLHGDAPFELEIGPGRGGYILERVAADPEARIVGLEIRRKWATLVDRRLHKLGVGQRARVYAEDGRSVLPRIAAGSVCRICVHFPDPWWKKRHRKRLLAQPELAEQAARLLLPGGDFFMQTDVEERAELYANVFDVHSEFEPWGGTARTPDPEFGARSSRERRAIEDGLPIIRLRYRRRA